MVTLKRLLLIVFVAGSALAISSCSEDEIGPSPQIIEINEFIMEHMNNVYLWNELIPEGIDPQKEMDPEALFERILNKPTDRWSWITDDHEELVNFLKGIEKTFGYEFKLIVLPSSNEIVGFVKYVIPDSPAKEMGIERGDMFYKVDGVALTTSNYRELLFNRDTYTLSFGSFGQGNDLIFREDKTLTSRIMSQNPIHVHKTIEFEGFKVGYLAYNFFNAEFDDSLVNAFSNFKANGIQDLILDLRYNPGGRGSTANLLSSMIVPSDVVNNNELFSTWIWNDQVMEYLKETEGENSPNLVSSFVNPEVNLNLERVYILISGNSASASELVINCLAPYMEVILVGPERTSGKYVGSITIDDEDADHGWALQPIVLRTANALGQADYVDGFAPNYYVNDDFNAPLGSLSEDMLAQAMELITGQSISEPARIGFEKLPQDEPELITPELESKQRLFLEF